MCCVRRCGCSERSCMNGGETSEQAGKRDIVHVCMRTTVHLGDAL